MAQMRLKADLALLLVAILWGSAFAAQRVAGQLGSVFFFNAARFLLAGLLLLGLRLRIRPSRSQLLWTVAAGTILFVASALQQAGLLTTTAGNAGFITSLYVVIVPFVMLVGWGERPHWLAVLAVLLAALGAFLLSAGGRLRLQAGDALELGGAVFWSLHVVLLGKFAAKFDAISFSAGQLLVGSVLNFGAASLFERGNMSLPPPLLGAILYTAVVSLGLGYTLQIWGQKHTPPTDAAILLSLESVFAVLGAWIWLITGKDQAPFPSLDRPFAHSADFCFGPCVAILGAHVPREAQSHLLAFQGERQIRRIISDSPRRVATAWLAPDIMIGGESTDRARPGSAHFHPATVYWRAGADEVGASSIFVEIAGRRLLVDAGLRPSPRAHRARSGCRTRSGL